MAKTWLDTIISHHAPGAAEQEEVRDGAGAGGEEEEASALPARPSVPTLCLRLLPHPRVRQPHLYRAQHPAAPSGPGPGHTPGNHQGAPAERSRKHLRPGWVLTEQSERVLEWFWSLRAEKKRKNLKRSACFSLLNTEVPPRWRAKRLTVKSRFALFVHKQKLKLTEDMPPSVRVKGQAAPVWPTILSQDFFFLNKIVLNTFILHNCYSSCYSFSFLSFFIFLQSTSKLWNKSC